MKAHIWRLPSPLHISRPRQSIQYIKNARFFVAAGIDLRHRLSKFWAPTGGLAPQDGDGEQDDSQNLLIRGGFLRQSHSGIFHLLPLGLRVQSKLEKLIDFYMQSIGASKASLSSLSTEALWRQSGRYSANSELLRVSDRRDSGFLLSPTHEEEITALVAGMVHSYKDLPLRLYQVGRKYRDEKRPRGGLLRAKEFTMKDLYTFDASAESALQTYEQVRAAYNAIFDALKIPYLVADADSGNMGGKLSHEYHFVSAKGEDTVWSCDACTYVANEELVEKAPAHTPSSPQHHDIITGISRDHRTAIHIPVPRTPASIPPPTWSTLSHHINLHALTRVLAPHALALDTSIDTQTLSSLLPKASSPPFHIPLSTTPSISALRPSDPCPRCPSGTLTSHPAIEVAHTFHLGTRYSEPLGALVSLPDGKTRAPMHMGCHGIGVSRLLGAIASLRADARGLNWPRVIAPWEIVVLASGDARDAELVYDAVTCSSQSGARVDGVLDDRMDKSLAWKLRDADLIGYPVVVVLGRAWRERREVEVQCRRLGVRRDVGVEGVRGVVQGLLKQL